jgi:hypothetical protein
MEFETDVHGQIVDPHHDGALDGIMVDGNECRLYYRSSDGMRRIILLRGVRLLDLSNFREGNIIMSIMVHSCQEASAKVSDEKIRRLGWGKISLFEGRYFFILDSSYGAEIIANCDSVQICLAEDHSS